MVNEDLSWHHGTCSMCKTRNILCLMFGYKQQEKLLNKGNKEYIHTYRICKNCLAENIQYILYGSYSYKDALTD